ncbi:MAG: hypothetical protein HKN75_10660 [Bacteroidia bacterium]|nr:hypothetical protein [Bacteroidia bacterium]
MEELKTNWIELLDLLNTKFDADMDLQGVLFLIGVQELGKGPQNFTKNEKMGLMHIATCRLMSTYGYYVLSGLDEDGWPHWDLTKDLPIMSLKEQDLLLKQSAIAYFKENEIF